MAALDKLRAIDAAYPTALMSPATLLIVPSIFSTAPF
jgi:hypothetical protein